MSEVTDLTVLEIKPEQAPALYSPNGLDAFLEQIKQAVNEVPDLSTKKGRDRIASLAAQVSRSKVAVEKPGREYLKRLKELPKEVEAELRRWVTECDIIRDETRRPLTEWEEAEDARKQALRVRLNALRALSDVIDEQGNYLLSDVIGERLAEAKSVQLDDTWQEFSGDAGIAKDSTIQKLESALSAAKHREEQAAELERLRKEAEEKAQKDREEELKRQAAEQARLDAEAKAKAEIDAANKREADAKAKAEAAERQRLSDAAQAERDRIAAEQKVIADKKAAEEKAEREKQQAIEAERRKAEEAEQARLAEEKRIADEAAARAANEKHRKAIGTEIVNALLANTNIDRAQAIQVLTALKDGLIPNATISY